MSYDLLRNDRLPGESFKEYKQRLKLVHKILKAHSKGKNAELRKKNTEESSEI